MKILALESSGDRLGACLWEDFRIRAHRSEESRQTGAAHLLPLVDGLFKKAKWAPQDIDAVAVDVGPGRFTGLRVGVTAARTLAMALEKPIVEVSSLEALAAEASGWQLGKHFVWQFPQDLLCVLTESIKEDVYMAVWRFHQLADRGRRLGLTGRTTHTFSHHFKLVHAPAVFRFERFLAFFKSCFQTQGLLFVGSGSVKYQTLLKDAFKSRARFALPLVQPDARWVAALAAERFFRRDMKTYTQVKPLYLRPSYAEENLARK